MGAMDLATRQNKFLLSNHAGRGQTIRSDILRYALTHQSLTKAPPSR